MTSATHRMGYHCTHQGSRLMRWSPKSKMLKATNFGHCESNLTLCFPKQSIRVIEMEMKINKQESGLCCWEGNEQTVETFFLRNTGSMKSLGVCFVRGNIATVCLVVRLLERHASAPFAIVQHMKVADPCHLPLYAPMNVDWPRPIFFL